MTDTSEGGATRQLDLESGTVTVRLPPQVLAVVSTRSLEQDRPFIPCSRAEGTCAYTGTIKKVLSEHGLGFIEAADGKEPFFHRSGMDPSVNLDSVMGGVRVIFDIEPSPRGRRAHRVRLA